MKLTPAQFREALDMSQETLRHWRRVLPLFQNRLGYAPVFTAGDLIAAAVIKSIKDKCGVSVSAFADHSIELGNICTQIPWDKLNEGSLILSFSDKSCIFVREDTCLSADHFFLVIPLAPITKQLADFFLNDRLVTQRFDQENTKTYKVASV